MSFPSNDLAAKPISPSSPSIDPGEDPAHKDFNYIFFRAMCRKLPYDCVAHIANYFDAECWENIETLIDPKTFNAPKEEKKRAFEVTQLFAKIVFN